MARTDHYNYSYLPTTDSSTTNELTIVVKRQDILCPDDFNEDAIVVEVDPDREGPERGELHQLLVVQPLLVVHVDQVVSARLQPKRES